MFFNKPKRNFFKLSAIGLFIVVLLSGYVFWQFYVPVGSAGSLTPVSVVAGEGVKQIGYNLWQNNLIRNRWWFETWVWLKRAEKKFVAGDYLLPSDANVVNITKLLTGGVRPANELSLTFIEGWTINQMADYLASNDLTTAKDFKALTNKPADFLVKYPDLKPALFAGAVKNGNLEGYLFPDTYRVYRSGKLEDILEKMLSHFQKQINEDWLKELDQRQISLHSLVTLASIVEREVQTDIDRAMVADIFWRRLAVGQGLQADSTVNYATGKSSPAVSLQDLKIDSPYNTYKYRGLPPGPISNPGLVSLRASLFPKANDYWYFLTTPQGQVIYSRNFDEHKAAKQKYLR
ncbi:endolytic transglycosylase MltG [Patescibacteria group bacterium]|nr:endolytic transglycosylase MltG [Patescibacteria group bacterium]